VEWLTRWWRDLLRDVVLTGTGLFMLLSQVFAKSPSDLLLVAGLALTVPATAAHAGALLSGRAPEPSSRPEPRPPSLPPSVSREVSGE
jgi:hypothetical protein